MTHELRKEIYAALDDWRDGGINSTQFVRRSEMARLMKLRTACRKHAPYSDGGQYGIDNEDLDAIISLCMEEAARCAELMAQDENGALEHSDTEAEKDQHQHGEWVAQQIAALIRHRALATPEGR